jgi:amino acid transporter
MQIYNKTKRGCLAKKNSSLIHATCKTAKKKQPMRVVSSTLFCQLFRSFSLNQDSLKRKTRTTATVYLFIILLAFIKIIKMRIKKKQSRESFKKKRLNPKSAFVVVTVLVSLYFFIKLNKYGINIS